VQRQGRTDDLLGVLRSKPLLQQKLRLAAFGDDIEDLPRLAQFPQNSVLVITGWDRHPLIWPVSVVSSYESFGGFAGRRLCSAGVCLQGGGAIANDPIRLYSGNSRLFRPEFV
jgi:hypothetical protein